MKENVKKFSTNQKKDKKTMNKIKLECVYLVNETPHHIYTIDDSLEYYEFRDNKFHLLSDYEFNLFDLFEINTLYLSENMTYNIVEFTKELLNNENN